MNLVGPKIVKRDTRFREATPVQERMAVTLLFWATGDSYTLLKYLSQISKQIVSQIVPEVFQALAKALIDNIQVKNCILHRAYCFAHKIDGMVH
jgi:hypothetical protein